MPAWPGGESPECGVVIPENLIHCQDLYGPHRVPSEASVGAIEMNGPDSDPIIEKSISLQKSTWELLEEAQAMTGVKPGAFVNAMLREFLAESPVEEALSQLLA